jgi:hypothetical protein
MTEFPEHIETKREVLRDTAVKLARIMELFDILCEDAMQASEEIDWDNPDPDAVDGERATTMVANWMEFQKLTRSVAGAMAIAHSGLHPANPLAAEVLNRWSLEMLSVEVGEFL